MEALARVVQVQAQAGVSIDDPGTIGGEPQSNASQTPFICVVTASARCPRQRPGTAAIPRTSGSVGCERKQRSARPKQTNAHPNRRLQNTYKHSNVERVLSKWGGEGVLGWFSADSPFRDADKAPLDDLAALVGGSPTEVLAMNALTVNLHLLLVAFYRPRDGKYKIIVEDGAFPSDMVRVRLCMSLSVMGEKS